MESTTKIVQMTIEYLQCDYHESIPLITYFWLIFANEETAYILTVLTIQKQVSKLTIFQEKCLQLYSSNFQWKQSQLDVMKSFMPQGYQITQNFFLNNLCAIPQVNFLKQLLTNNDNLFEKYLIILINLNQDPNDWPKNFTLTSRTLNFQNMIQNDYSYQKMKLHASVDLQYLSTMKQKEDLQTTAPSELQIIEFDDEPELESSQISTQEAIQNEKLQQEIGLLKSQLQQEKHLTHELKQQVKKLTQDIQLGQQNLQKQDQQIFQKLTKLQKYFELIVEQQYQVLAIGNPKTSFVIAQNLQNIQKLVEDTEFRVPQQQKAMDYLSFIEKNLLKKAEELLQYYVEQEAVADPFKENLNLALNEAQLRYKSQIDTYKQDICNLYKQIDVLKQENFQLQDKLNDQEKLIQLAKIQQNETIVYEQQIQALKKMIQILQEQKSDDQRSTGIDQEQEIQKKYHSNSMDQYVRPKISVRREIPNEQIGQGSQCFTLC